MIVFLTLCYCGLLALLVQLKVIKLTLWWKLSPAVWMCFLLIALFIPMQWGAPVGSVNTYQDVVEIIPNISGEVIEVPVDGIKVVEKGDILFKLDPEPFQAKVDQLNAQLADATQTVEQLKAQLDAANATVDKAEADIELAKADERTADAGVSAAKAALEELKGKKRRNIAVRDDLIVQVAAAQREFDRVETLVARKAATESELDIAKVKITSLKSQLNAAEVDVTVSDDSIARGEADVAAADATLSGAKLRLKQLVETELPRVKAKAREADLAANSTVNGEHTLIANARAQLEQAEYNLKECVVRAPSRGYVLGATLRPGQRVANLPLRSWMSFVVTDKLTIGVGIPQYARRHVKVGQKAEVTLKLYPGKVFPATVDAIGQITSEGQLQPSGIVMSSPGVNEVGVPFGVRLRLDDDLDLKQVDLPGGAAGTAAIYTEKMKATHIIRKVMLRMEAYVNYINPW